VFSCDACVTRVRARASLRRRRRLHSIHHHTTTPSLQLLQYYCDGRPLHSARPCWSVLPRGVRSSSVFFVRSVFCILFFSAAGSFRLIFSRDVFVTVVFFYFVYAPFHAVQPSSGRSVGRRIGTKQCVRIANAENGRRYCFCKEGRPRFALSPIVYAAAADAFRWKSWRPFSKVPIVFFYFHFLPPAEKSSHFSRLCTLSYDEREREKASDFLRLWLDRVKFSDG